jgi:hypothetical protein
MSDVEIKGAIVKQTDMAIAFRPGFLVTAAVWLPRSQVAVVQEVDGARITLPLWLAEEKGLT